MKRTWHDEIWKGLGLLILLGLTGMQGVASTMRPSVIIHGEVRDAFGIRLRTGVQVSAFLGSNEVARTTVALYPQGENYRLLLDVNDPATAEPGQVVPGDEITMKVKVGTDYQSVIGETTFLVPGDGVPVELDLIMGTDTDGDGLPDEWEEMVIANSSGSVQTILHVGPGRDLDGDGMFDDQEFWYGSFAFLPGDELKFGMLTRHDDRYSFTFLSIMDVVYGVDVRPQLTEGGWDACPIATGLTEDLSPTTFRGTGDFMTIYFAVDTDTAFYRLQTR